MVSICIPIYNTLIANLVNGIVADLHEVEGSELIFCDDDSKKSIVEENRMLAQKHEGVRLLFNETNLGRSATRNKLVKAAKNDWLLFLDGDMLVESGFVKRYLKYLNTADCLVGGIKYEAIPPIEKEQYLRWYYGIKREMKAADYRNKFVYRSFMTGNFLIRKSVIEALPFDEQISKYGHEDTLMGLSLKHNKISLKHIDNAAEHLGIDTADVFIKKSTEALHSLQYVGQLLVQKGWTNSNIRILEMYLWLEKWYIKAPMRLLFKLFGAFMRQNLLGQNPSLLFFDLYRLGYFCEIQSSNNSAK